MPSLNTGNAILSNAIAVNSSYNVGIGGAASGTFKLDVNGSVNLAGNVTTTGAQFVQNGFYLANANAGATAFYTNMWGADDGIQFALRNLTGGARFIFQSATSYNYTFPAATGTLALTSNLSAYLPLTGGTLTGALNGTSATFSGNMAIGGTTITDANMLNVIGNQSSVNIGLVLNNTNATYPKIYAIQNVNANLVFYDYSASATRLTISNTGAATFSSSIAATSATFSNTTTGTNAIFSSRLGVGISNDQTYASLFVGGDITTGVNQYAIITDPQLSGTSNSYALFANARIKASTAVTNAFGVYISSAEKMSGASITNNYALYIANQTSGSSTNYSIYSSGGLNYFGGSVGIGTSSPVSTLDTRGVLSVGGAAGTYSVIQRSTTPSGSQGIILTAGTAKTESGGGITFADNANSGGTIILSGNSSDIYGGGVFLVAYGQTAASNIITFSTRSGAGTTAERMVITSGGNVGIATSPITTYRLSVSYGGAGNGGIAIQDVDNAIGSTYMAFMNSSGGAIGSISRNGGFNQINYNTTSDYRLKEDFKDFNGLDKVSAIKVYDHKWIGFEDRTNGVIAHELADVIPYAVSGEKDAIDDNGNMKYQQVDYSKLVPVLVKAIQELNQKVNEQQQTINSLINR